MVLILFLQTIDTPEVDASLHESHAILSSVSSAFIFSFSPVTV